MTKDEMIEELLEYQLQSVPALELIQMYIQLTRAMMSEELSDDEVLDKYTELFGDAEALH
jgi:hypothetical protein